MLAVTMTISSAADLIEGLTRYAQLNHVQALAVLRPLADQGDPVAQEILGTIYFEGLILPRNQELALQYFLKAAVQGRPGAQFAVGIIFRDGVGVHPDVGRAIKWLQLAADNGSVHAFSVLGELHIERAGMSPNVEDALRWLHLGAYTNDFAALYNLGRIYAEGLGIERNEIEAYKWFALAVDAGLDDDRDTALLICSALAERLTPMQVAIARRDVQEWIDRSPHHSSDSSQRSIRQPPPERPLRIARRNLNSLPSSGE